MRDASTEVFLLDLDRVAGTVARLAGQTIALVGLFFAGLFSFSQAGTEFNKYQSAMGEVVTDTEPPRAPLALIERFDPARDLGPADELLVLARWSGDLPIIEFDGASLLDFTVLPLLSTTEDWVVGLALAGLWLTLGTVKLIRTSRSSDNKRRSRAP